MQGAPGTYRVLRVRVACACMWVICVGGGIGLTWWGIIPLLALVSDRAEKVVVFIPPGERDVVQNAACW